MYMYMSIQNIFLFAILFHIKKWNTCALGMFSFKGTIQNIFNLKKSLTLINTLIVKKQ